MTTLSSSPAPSAPPADRRDLATVIVFALAAIALIASVAAVGFGLRAIDESEANVSAGGGGDSASAAGPVAVTLADFKIEPKTFSVATGGTIKLTNDGASPHNLAIEGTDARTPMLDAGGG